MRNPSRRLAQGISEAMKGFSVEYETVDVVTNRRVGTLLNEMFYDSVCGYARESTSVGQSSLKS